ncbi:hypothetical protein DM02DRAFT_650841 [Periconia macrospinosa]|uniref:Uncharacterized protein n=1 Tax=Periconia macrospinosa TaxID=97972 RepID=A0A2V1E4V2_9PLEO|nr:hypothetical protein DM02DRAFT_650841 [Periconia macrospinosa]
MHIAFLIKTFSAIHMYMVYATKPPMNELPAIYSPRFRRLTIRDDAFGSNSKSRSKSGFLPAVVTVLVAVSIICAGFIYAHRKWRQRVDQYGTKVWHRVNFIRTYKKNENEENEVEEQHNDTLRLTLPEPIHFSDLELALSGCDGEIADKY